MRDAYLAEDPEAEPAWLGPGAAKWLAEGASPPVLLKTVLGRMPGIWAHGRWPSEELAFEELLPLVEAAVASLEGSQRRGRLCLAVVNAIMGDPDKEDAEVETNST